MPKYSYTCSSCNTEVQKLVPRPDYVINCNQCDAQMTRKMPTIAGQQVRETVDSYTNVSWAQDQKDMMTERKLDYFWSIEVPRLVKTHCLQTCLEQGWVYIDDKGQVQTHTKPPGKR